MGRHQEVAAQRPFSAPTSGPVASSHCRLHHKSHHDHALDALRAFHTARGRLPR